MSPPVAVVGLSWRNASTALRARLAAVAEEAEPLATLRKAGYVSGAAVVTTCSRTEWILTADQPEWAANLLRGALASQLTELSPEALQVRAGAAAVHYLLRVAVGLDSVAEGEGAVGRQLLKAFEAARRVGRSDARLHRVWKHVERLLGARRDEAPGGRSLGVQSLVREVLHERGARTVALLGRGEFGLAMERCLRGLPSVALSTWTRQSLPELLTRLGALDALVVCTGAQQPWLELPRGAALCIDAGSPPQVRLAPGWEVFGLDALLARPELHLGDAQRERLEQLVATASAGLTADLAAPAPASALAAIDADRAAFLNEQLPALLAGLSAQQARRVRQAVGAFTHQLLRRTREASS